MPFYLNNREVVSIQTAVKLVGVSRRSLYNWMAKGFIQYEVMANGHRRIYVDTMYRNGGRPSLSFQQPSSTDVHYPRPTPPPQPPPGAGGSQ